MGKITLITLMVLIHFSNSYSQCELYIGPKTKLYIIKSKKLVIVDVGSKLAVGRYSSALFSSYYKVDYNFVFKNKKNQSTLKNDYNRRSENTSIHIIYQPSISYIINYDYGFIYMNRECMKFINSLKIDKENLDNFIPMKMYREGNLTIGTINLKKYYRKICVKLKGEPRFSLDLEKYNSFRINYYYPWWRENKFIGKEHIRKFKIENMDSDRIILQSKEILLKEDKCDCSKVDSFIQKLN